LSSCLSSARKCTTIHDRKTPIAVNSIHSATIKARPSGGPACFQDYLWVERNRPKRSAKAFASSGHGLIRASFVPNAQTQEMRNLLRTRKQLVREQASHVQRVQKTLEDANIRLDSVLADVMGTSGRAMIEALIAGETNPINQPALPIGGSRRHQRNCVRLFVAA
jgi:hypothetical protein